MSKPWIHAKSSARKFGGTPEDYIDIHQFMDSSKACLPDVRHRAVLHSSFGCFIVEKVFGIVLTNSDGKEFSPRDIAEQHCLEDMGTIPTLEDWLGKKGEPGSREVEVWMGPPKSRKEHIKYEDL